MPSSRSDQMEKILDRFDDAWNGVTPPGIEDFVVPADSPEHLRLLVELLKIDMERRLKRGERVRLEEMYLPRFPELDAVPSVLLALVIHECELRQHEPGLSSQE